MTYKIIDFTGDAEGKITLNLMANGVLLNTITDITVKDAADAATVFVVTNNCNFFSHNITVGHTFFFTILTDPQVNTECVQCSMFERTPMARLTIEVVKSDK